MSKAEAGNWDEDFKEDENQTSEKSTQQETNKTRYMDMSKPGSYKIRLVGPHIKCRKRFKPYRSTVQVHEKDLDIAWSEGWPAPSKRYAVNVIDKTDLQDGETGELKVLEKGPSVFKNFANYKAVFNVNPAGKEGPDFLITVTIPLDDKGNLNKLKTEYTVTHLDKAPFTDAEKKILCKVDEEGNVVKDDSGKPVFNLWPLKDIYKSTSSDKMQEMWDALSDSQKTPPKRDVDVDVESSTPASSSASSAPAIEESMSDAPANSDDLFGDAEGGGDTDSPSESGELF